MQSFHLHLYGSAIDARALFDQLVAEGLIAKIEKAGGGDVSASYSRLLVVPSSKQRSTGRRRQESGAGSHRTSGRKH